MNHCSYEKTKLNYIRQITKLKLATNQPRVKRNRQSDKNLEREVLIRKKTLPLGVCCNFMLKFNTFIVFLDTVQNKTYSPTLKTKTIRDCC